MMQALILQTCSAFTQRRCGLNTRSRASTSGPAYARRRGRAALVRANGLNKWGDVDGGDSDAGQHDDSFDKDTATVVLRVLTARATQTVLAQLQEFDLHVAHYLNNFAADNPPSDGNKFILKLFEQPGKAVLDANTQETHAIDPQGLAHRILQVRAEMANSVTQRFPAFVSLENTSVLRAHLSRSTYTCGSTEQGYKERRGHFRPNRRNSRSV